MKLLFSLRCIKYNIVDTPSHTFVMFFCRGLLLELAVAICRENLPQRFALAICPSYLFCASKQTFSLCEQMLFLCKQIFFNWKKTFFICQQNPFLFMRITLLSVILFVIAVAVIGHSICAKYICISSVIQTLEQSRKLHKYNKMMYEQF